MNAVKINKLLSLVLIVVIVYAVASFVKLQAKLNSYNKDIAYYDSQIAELKEKQESLKSTQANVSSEEYIEEVARESLDMYLPSETVYIDINK